MNRIACIALVLVAVAGCGEEKKTPAAPVAPTASNQLPAATNVGDAKKPAGDAPKSVSDDGKADLGRAKAKKEWAAQIGDIPFSADWQTAMAQARASKKPLMFLFTDKKSPDVTKMGGVAFKDARVVDAAKGFVVALVDVDADPSFADRYTVRGVPTIVYADEKGDAAGTTIGASTADEVLRDMKGALDTLKEDADEAK